jgi:hypothetical protein
MWRVAVSVLNEPSRTAEKGWFSCGFVEGLTTPHLKNKNLAECYSRWEGVMGRECSKGEKKFLHGFCREAIRKETTWKT